MDVLARGLSLAAKGLILIGVTLLIACVVGLVLLQVHHARFMSVQSASMAPALQPGDAIITAPASRSNLRVGDIISYKSPHNPGAIITHRLTAIHKQTGQLTTKGDARYTPDPAFQPSMVVGRAVAVAPELGLVLDFLRKPLSLALIIYLPAWYLAYSHNARI